jgi:hypothetical protein
MSTRSKRWQFTAIKGLKFEQVDGAGEVRNAGQAEPQSGGIVI